MNHLKLIPILTLLFLYACQSSQNKETKTFEQDVNALATVELQKQFLEEIGELDQKVRHDETDANQNFGYDSKEHKASWDKIMEVDAINLNKIELYLKTYGYPTIDKHGKDAAGAPWIVVHHASGGIAPRYRNFKHLYRAYKTKDLDSGAFALYLNRWYDHQYNSRIKWNGPYRIEQELDTLFKSLDLLEEVKEVDAEFMTD